MFEVVESLWREAMESIRDPFLVSGDYYLPGCGCRTCMKFTQLMRECPVRIPVGREGGRTEGKEVQR